MEIQQLAQRLSDPISQQAHQDVLKALEFKKTMRAQRQAAQLAPITQAMDSNSAAYNAATTDEDRNKYNALNSLIRANLLKGGFNPTDIDQKYWGNTPGQFQTPTGYEAPVTGYEGLKRMDVMAARRQGLSDEMERRKLEIAITGIDPTTGQKTWDRQLQEMQYALSAAKGSGGGSGGSTKAPPSLYDQAKAAAYNDPRLWTGKEDVPEGSWALEDLISAYMKTYGGGGGQQGGGNVAAMIQQARANGYSDDEIRQGLIDDGYDPAQYGF